MADKMSTIVLDVNLDCSKCYKKVRKTLCRFNGEIKSWSFDEKQKKVTISGPFNPECLIKRLYCKVGCKIITGYKIIIPKPPSSTPSSTPKTESSTPTKPPAPPPPPPPPPCVVNVYVGPPGSICYCRCRGNCYGTCCSCSCHFFIEEDSFCSIM